VTDQPVTTDQLAAEAVRVLKLAEDAAPQNLDVAKAYEGIADSYANLLGRLANARSQASTAPIALPDVCPF
jgi:hypothetical protein